MNIANIYRSLKQILNDSNNALLNKGLNRVSTLDKIPNELKKIGEFNRLPYLIDGELVALFSEDFFEENTTIGKYAFYDCSSLTSVTIPSSVTSIGSYAFYGCSSLTSVTIPNSVTSIDDSAFEYCIGLTNFAIPDSVISIGNGAFRSCRSLTSIIIGNGVTSIGNEAFYGCSSLTSVTIPSSVISIGKYAFYICSKLKDIYLYRVTPPILGNLLISFGMNVTIHVPVGSGDVYKSATNWSSYASKIVEDIVID